jgi:vanadium-dependent haloperoxidase-like protein
MQANHCRSRRAGLGLVFLAAAVLALGGATASSAKPGATGTPDTHIAYWDGVGTQAFTAAALTPAEGHVIFAYVAIAVYDSVMGIEGGHEPFAVDANAPDDASPEAAVVGAASTILAHYLPAQAGMINAERTASLANIPDGAPETHGLSFGDAVANLLIAQRADDGFRAAYTYTVPNPPVAGKWLPTATTPPIGTYLGHMKPFALRSADQFRPNGPPALDSKQWADEYNEVKTVGSNATPLSVRSAAQTEAARFWAQAPVQQARGSFRKFVLDHQLDIADASRFMAMASVTYADGLIACFDAKYLYAFWRPITAIRAGDTDLNTATVGDPNWTPLLPVTPNHPEYPSAHSCITPAAGRVIARFLQRQQIDFTIPSLAAGIADRHFNTSQELESDVANGRVWGGIHFRTAVEDGVQIAKRTANYVLAHNFQQS